MGKAVYAASGEREFLDKQGCLHEHPIAGEGRGQDEDEFSDNDISLLEENARLRGLVVKLTDIILRNVVDRS
jgi:hypothetical protein